MHPDDEHEGHDEVWARLRDGVLFAAKAAFAVAALSGVAQYVSRTTLDRHALGFLATHAGDPKTTGSLMPPRRPSLVGAPQGAADQAGMASLVSQVSRASTTERKR
jgi:hypothetical protein